MQKIIIIGSPGSGKSFFARKLHDLTNLPLYHLDLIWHKPDKTNISKKDFDKQLKIIINKEKWIVDGNYQRTLNIRLKKCDTVFLMDFPIDVCLMGALSRIGTKREDLPWIETEFDDEFKQWIIDFPTSSLPYIYRKLKRLKDSKNIIIFKSRSEANNYLEKDFYNL